MNETRRAKKIRIFIYINGFLVSAMLIISALFHNDNWRLQIILGAGGLFIPLSLLVLDIIHIRYADKLLIKLSELINKLIDMKEEEVFSETEDNLLSKLQTQVIKLSGILKSHNRTIEKEKNEIQTLISDISHQLKTPLASMKMFGELLAEPDLTEGERKEYCDILNQSLDKLTFLTESMIRISRLESGIIQLKPLKTDLNELLLEAIKQIYFKAVYKKVSIIFDPQEEVWINLDVNWTREAIINILDNGIKYSRPDGTLTIKVTEYDIYTRIDITDNGLGIEEKEQSKIFQRFYRGRGSEDKEGVGIGLYLARKVITQQNGYIKVSSDGRTGSTFSLFLPR